MAVFFITLQNKIQDTWTTTNWKKKPEYWNMTSIPTIKQLCLCHSDRVIGNKFRSSTFSAYTCFSTYRL